MSDVICRKCGAVNNYHTKLVSNNNVATCNACNSYIKNLPYDEPKLYIGKYKGKEIKSIDDLPYLKWAHDNMGNLTKRVKGAMHEQIIRLENLLR